MYGINKRYSGQNTSEALKCKKCKEALSKHLAILDTFFFGVERRSKVLLRDVYPTSDRAVCITQLHGICITLHIPQGYPPKIS